MSRVICPSDDEPIFICVDGGDTEMDIDGSKMCYNCCNHDFVTYNRITSGFGRNFSAKSSSTNDETCLKEVDSFKSVMKDCVTDLMKENQLLKERLSQLEITQRQLMQHEATQCVPVQCVSTQHDMGLNQCEMAQCVPIQFALMKNEFGLKQHEAMQYVPGHMQRDVGPMQAEIMQCGVMHPEMWQSKASQHGVTCSKWQYRDLCQIETNSFCQCLPSTVGRELYRWRVPDLSHVSMSRGGIYSPSFRTRPGGYRVCLSVTYSTIHFTWHIFCYLVRGDHDSLLSWPYTGDINVFVIDARSGRRLKARETYREKVDHSDRQRPCNNNWWVRFDVTCDELKTGPFIVEDSMTLIVHERQQ